MYTIIVTEREHRKNGRYLIRTYATRHETYDDMDAAWHALKDRTASPDNLLQQRPVSFDMEAFNLDTGKAARVGTTRYIVSM